MKKSIAILFLSILTAFSTFFSSCENLANDEVESTSQKGKINYVNISEVPFLIPTIQKFNPDYAFLSDPSKPSNKETLNLNLDLNSILEYIGLDGRKTYSIKILHEFNDYDDKYLENLHVFKENEEYKSFILKFNSLDDTKPFDENTFTGDAEIYDLEHELQSISNYEDGILRCNKIINGPWHIWIHNGTIDVWYDESYNQGDVDLSSYSNEFVFLATAPPAPGENGGGGAMSTNLDVMLFLNDLTEEQLSIVQQSPELITYLEENNASQESRDFVQELINLAQNTDDQEVSKKLIKLTLITKQNNYFNQPFDSNYNQLIQPYIEVDLQTHSPVFWAYFTAQCAIARYKLSHEPGWNNLYEWQQDAKVYWAALEEMIHLGLDLIGLVPVVGEVADLTNGVIYTIQGEGVNATLSFASAIPVAGWFSAGVKFAKRADGLAYTVKAVNNLIDFGKYNSKKFRTALGLLPGDPRQAHHIIPRGSQIISHEVVQRAAQATTNQGFHIDQALNGVAVAAWRNQPNHTAYNNLIKSKLDDYLDNFPNATPQQCYNQLMQIINQGKQAIINNPNVHLNNITF